MLGTDHRDRVLSADAIELGHHIGTVLDEPNADSSCLPTYLLSGFAREHVTVALSGDGGDEMFGGYGRYFVTVDEWERKRKGDQSLGWWRAGEVYWSSRILVYPRRPPEGRARRDPGRARRPARRDAQGGRGGPAALSSTFCARRMRATTCRARCSRRSTA